MIFWHFLTLRQKKGAYTWNFRKLIWKNFFGPKEEFWRGLGGMGAEKFSLHVTRIFLHLALRVQICVKFWYIAKERPFNLISHTQPVSPHKYMHNVVWSLRNIKWNLGLWGNLAPARIFWILDSWKCHLKSLNLLPPVTR